MSLAAAKEKTRNNNNNNSDQVHDACWDGNSSHDPRLTYDGLEYVCARCGVVLSPAAEEADAFQVQPKQKSRLNLYVGHQLGGTGVAMKSLPQLSDRRSPKVASSGSGPASATKHLSAFSNACDRLGMSPAEAEHAWCMFCKIYPQLSAAKPRRASAAEAALYSICCYCSTADEYEATNAVSYAFGTRHMRDLYHLRIIISTRIEESSSPGTGMRLTTSALWMRGVMARKFFNAGGTTTIIGKVPTLSAYSAQVSHSRSKSR